MSAIQSRPGTLPTLAGTPRPRRSGSNPGPLGATGGWGAFSLIFSLTQNDVACRRQVSTDCPGKPEGAPAPRPATGAPPNKGHQTWI